MIMLEETVEARLVKQALAFGGQVRKLKWIARRTAPDRLLTLPQSGISLVELKRPGKDAEAAQAREHERLRKAGARVVVLNTLVQVDEFIERMTAMDDDALKARLAAAESIFERAIAAYIKRLEEENAALAQRVAELERKKP